MIIYFINVKPGNDLVDIWVSHYPKDLKLGKVTGIGMNQYELKNFHI